MRFLVDNCLDVRVASWLREQGYEAVHLRERGGQTLPDGEVFRQASAESRVLVTLDLDFGEIVSLAQGKHPAVVVLRLRDTRTHHVLARLEVGLRYASAALSEPGIVIIEEGRVRIRSYPR